MSKKEKIEYIYFGNSSYVYYSIESDFYDGKREDTRVNLSGVNFTIGGSEVNNFKQDLKDLIDKYFI